MKKLHILGVAISAVLCAPMAAQASDGVITFDGLLKATTCTVTAPSGGNLGITLPTLATSLLNASGKTAGDTPFSITVGNCTAGVSFTPYFESGANIDPLTGRLNSTGGATFVQLELLNKGGLVIDLAGVPGAQHVAATPIVGPGGTGYYAVRYYATGAATAGTVNSTVTYSMSYL